MGLISTVQHDDSRDHIMNYLQSQENQSGRGDTTNISISSSSPPTVEASEILTAPLQRDNIMSVRQLVHADPPYRVPAKPWTTIGDDEQISHLVSTYFTWWDTFCMVIDRDVFLEAMRSKQPDHPLCSPFLVHAILALASVSIHQERGLKTSTAEVDYCDSNAQAFRTSTRPRRAF